MKVLDIKPQFKLQDVILKDNNDMIGWNADSKHSYVINKKDYLLYNTGKKKSINVYQLSKNSYEFCATVRHLTPEVSFIYDTYHNVMGFLLKGSDDIYRE